MLFTSASLIRGLILVLLGCLSLPGEELQLEAIEHGNESTGQVLDTRIPQPIRDLIWRIEDGDDAAIVTLLERGSAVLAETDDADLRYIIVDAMAPHALRLLFTPLRVPGMERLGLVTYIVQSGDNPTKIARSYGISYDYLPLANDNYRHSALRPGQELKVLDAASSPVRIMVRRDQYRLVLVRDGVLLAAFPVGIGTEDRQTPTGETTIGKRVRDPEWRHPDTGQIFQPSDPGNVLGGYWLGFEAGDEGTFQGIGIHGYTGAPVEDWIERPGSRGCLRMRQADIDRLFALVRRGWVVAVH